MIPLITVCIPTYNQERFIAQAIESVLGQQTDFPFEVLIGEDESSDRTRDICLQYQENYPEIIKLTFGRREEVIYIDGVATGRANLLRLLSQASGIYVALCEGDDYWTSPHKLQEQVQFLESNSDYTLCMHDSLLVDENSEILSKNFCRRRQTGEFALEEFFIDNKVATASKVFRSSAIMPPPEANNVLAYDWLLSIYAGERGKMHYFDEVWSAYRIHSQGIWQAMDILEMRERAVTSLKEINKFFDSRYAAQIGESILIRLKELKRLYRNRKKPVNYIWALLAILKLQTSRLFRSFP